MFRKSMLILLLMTVSVALPLKMTASDTSSGQVLGGSVNAPVRIEVYSDFQCPSCRELYLGTIRQILREYASKDKVCVIYHEFPLPGHKYSQNAARYAEASAKLGVQKLLLVMDALFTDQAAWSQDGKLDIPVAKALSPKDFQSLKQILKDSNINLAIEREIQLANQKQIKSTPTMIINYSGKQQRVEGLVTYLVMKNFIDAIVK